MFPFIKKKYKITKEKERELRQELKKLEKDAEDAANRLEESRREDSDEDDANLGIIADEKMAIEKRIKEITQILDNFELIEDKTACTPNQVALGSTIKVEDGGKVMELKLVSSLEADPLKNYISDGSPLGKKLLNAKVGDTVGVSVRGKKTEYKILEIC
jgi:transcription elongation factor GreA